MEERLEIAPQASNTSVEHQGVAQNHFLGSSVPFEYDPDLFKLCLSYVKEKNHHGLALLARQKGIPPFLRFKVWPILLKYHPFVHNPFVQPDFDSDRERKMEKSSSKSSRATSQLSMEAQTQEENADNLLKTRILKDVRKYIHRLAFNKEKSLTDEEEEIFTTIEHSVFRFAKKWGRIINYDKAMAWLALGLAEWFPPIPQTPYVLVGRNITSNQKSYKSVFSDYQDFIDEVPGLQEHIEELLKEENMKFHDVFERLALVLLHSPEKKERSNSNSSTSSSTSNGSNRSGKTSSVHSSKINKLTLPIKGGTIEERVAFFIYLLRKLMPELCSHFQEEQILNKFGSNDDEWLIWWLKWCGCKVWLRLDRGRLWDLMLGYKKNDPSYAKKLKKLKLDLFTLDLLGPEVFWSAIDIEDEIGDQNEKSGAKSSESSTVAKQGSFTSEFIRKASSFKDLLQGLSANWAEDSKRQGQATTQPNSKVPSTRSSSVSSSSTSSGGNIPVSKLNPHIELIFISIAMLKSREHTIVELDQHEIRQYLLKLPSKSYGSSDKYKQHMINRRKEKEKKDNDSSSDKKDSDSNLDKKDEDSHSEKTEADLKSETKNNDSHVDHDNHQSSSPLDTLDITSLGATLTDLNASSTKKNYIDNVINEAGELWRKWLWLEMRDDE